MKLARTAICALAATILLVAVVGCTTATPGKTGMAIVDNLTGQANGTLRIANVAAITSPAAVGGADGVVQITVTFTGNVTDATVVSGSTMIVRTADGSVIPGVVTTGVTANDTIVVWTSQQVYRAGGAYTVRLIGTTTGATGAILGRNGTKTSAALDGDGIDGNANGIPDGDGLPGGNATIAVVAP